MMQRGFASVLLIVGLTLPAQSQVKLEWKFKEGDIFYVENQTKTKQAMGTGEQKRKQEKTTTAVARYRVLKATPAGAILEMKMEGIKVTGTDPLAEAFAKIAEGQKDAFVFRITLTPSGQVTKIEGLEEYIRKIVGSDEESIKAFRSTGFEETVKEGLNQTFGFLPDKPVSKGDKWKRQSKLQLSFFGTIKSNTEYTHQGSSKEGEKVTFTGPWTYEPPMEKAGFPIKITKGDVKVEKTEGVLFFDAAAGRLVRFEHVTRLKGVFTTKVLDKERDNELEQESTVKSRMTNNNPWK